MKRAVITGATGVVGRALIEELASERVEILLLLRDSPRAARLPDHPLIKKAVCPLEELGTCEIGGEYDAFFHLAWAGTYGGAREDVALQEANVRYARDAAALSARLGCGVFVGIGSQAEYGRVPYGVRLGEKTPLRPESAYGKAKDAARRETRALCDALGVRHVWARLLSVYGKYDAPHSLVMSAIAAFSRGEAGAFTRGDQLFDYLYARDAAHALFLLAKQGKHGKAYALGSGVARPLREYVLDIRDEIDPEISPRFGAIPYFDGQARYLCADLEEISRDTGFLPSVSFREGVRRTLAWYRKK